MVLCAADVADAQHAALDVYDDEGRIVRFVRCGLDAATAGFEVTPDTLRSLTLAGMRNRAAPVDGRVLTTSVPGGGATVPGEGTTLVLEVPR